MKKIERRAFPIALRAEQDTPTIRGHAAVFNQDADIGGYFTERIAPGAFKESIETDDIRALWNHNPDIVLGRNKANTLRLSEDDKGLAVEIDPPESATREVESIRRGDVSQMSIGIVVLDDEWRKENGINARTIKRAQLWDVSPVTFPAYTQTDVQVRSAAEVAAEIPDSRRPAGQAAPPAKRGGVGLDLLRRRLELAEREIQ